MNTIRFLLAIVLATSMGIVRAEDSDQLSGEGIAEPVPPVEKSYNVGGKLNLVGGFSFTIDNNTGQTTFTFEELDNDSLTTTSGNIIVALVATTTPIVAGQGFTYWIVARRNLNPLLPNYYYGNVTTVATTESVPNGVYYLTLVVFEQEFGCTSTGVIAGYCSDDFIASSIGQVQVNGGIWSSYSATTLAVEYYNASFGHYFITADSDEIAGLDAGAYNFAFQRTGQTFKVWTSGSALDVCRFFTTPGTFGTKSSHFYTAIASECNGLKANPNWIYEKIAAKVALPVNGVCPAGTVPLYRLYNNGMTGAPNHRYTTSLTIRSQMIGAGWVPEDVNTACVPI